MTKILQLAGSLSWAAQRPNVPDGSTLYDSDTDTHYVRENGEWKLCPQCKPGAAKASRKP